jgi:hypothetical protein
VLIVTLPQITLSFVLNLARPATLTKQALRERLENTLAKVVLSQSRLVGLIAKNALSLGLKT